MVEGLAAVAGQKAIDVNCYVNELIDIERFSRLPSYGWVPEGTK